LTKLFHIHIVCGLLQFESEAASCKDKAYEDFTS